MWCLPMMESREGRSTRIVRGSEQPWDQDRAHTNQTHSMHFLGYTQHTGTVKSISGASFPHVFFLLSPKSPLSTKPTTGGAPIATQLLELGWQLLSNKDMDKLRSHKEKASKTLLMSTLGIIFTSPQSPHDPAASLLLVSKQAVLLTGALLDAAALLQCVSAQLAVEVFLPKFSKPDVAAVVVQCPAGEVAIETCPGKRGQRG